MPQAGRSPEPKPGQPPTLKRWFQERPSEYPWEQDGLDHIRNLMPEVEPYRPGRLYSFTAASGRINECDLLIAVPGGLYLVELKGHPEHVVNNGETWSFHERSSRRVRTLRNPLHLIDLKSKELKNRLEWAAQPPQRELGRVTPEFSRHVLPELMKKIGIRVSTAHLRFGDDWTLQPEPLDARPTWEDRLAERKGIVREEGRVRIYLTAQQTTEEAKKSATQAAQREYQVLRGITHRGIAQDDGNWHRLDWEHTPMLNTPFSAGAARYARALAAKTDRFADLNTALAQVLARWSTGEVTDRRERRMAARLAAERAAIPGLADTELAASPQQQDALALPGADTNTGAHLTVVSDDDDEEDELLADLDGFYDDALEVLE